MQIQEYTKRLFGVYKARLSEQFGCGTEFSPEFNVVDANGTPKPDAPTKLVATPFTQTAISLAWTQGANETGFEIYRSKTSAGPYSFVTQTNINAIAFTDTGLAANTSYYYVLRAVNNTGASDKSNEATAKTMSDRSFPVAPSNLQYRGSTATSVQLSWAPGTDNGGIKRYDIYVNGTKRYSTSATRFDVKNLDSLTNYTFTVKAIDNSENASASSNQVTAFTHRQGLKFKYYTTTASWYTIPNLKALTPAKSGIMDSVNINDKTVNALTERYAFLWEGYIYVPATSTYTFETRSDDGSKLYIDVPYTHTAKAVVNNDTIHGMRSRTGTITLSQGYHSIAVTFFQRVNGWGLELYWKNSSGLARELIPKNFFSIEPVGIPTPPATPTGVSATAVSHNQITVNWTDNNSGETGYELVRSTTSGGVYVPVGTTNTNATSFTDSGLLASRAYYYKVRTINASGESSYSPVVSATTQAAPKLVPAPSPLTAISGANNAVVLNWQDNAINEWNYRVYRSTNGTTFNVIFASKPNVNAFTDLTAQPQIIYHYYVLGYNGSGLGPKSNIVKVKAGNSAPVFGNMSNIFVKTGQTVNNNFNVNDEAGDQVEVNVINKPAFVSVVSNSGNNFTLTVNPSQDNVGQYTLTLEATDNNGASSRSQVVITVADVKTKSVYVNFGETGKTAKAPWNNWLGKRLAGDAISNLADENNNPTTISVTTVNGWNGTTVLGHLTGNNSGVAPDSVLESGLTDNGTARQLLISGLDPAKKYNLQFIGSQNEGIVANTQYASSSSETATLDARYNTHRSANLNGLSPNGSGEIVVTITRAGSTPVSYLNGMIIEELVSTSALLNPEHLYGEAQDRNSVMLSWTERTSGEDITGGYEIQRATDSLFQQNVGIISLGANAAFYKDENLQPDTKYWYRVRAKKGSEYSDYSNKYTVVTPASIIYVNFNSTLPDESAPWNNTAASPLSEFIIDNLYNQSGAVSGLSLMVTKVFNGEFTAGATTGNNSGVVPDKVLASNFWLDNTQQCQIKLSGFNHTKRYRIGFVGSSSTPGWFKGNYTATYTVNGKTVYLNSWMNTTKAVYIGDLSPDANGDIFLDFSTTAIAQWAFNAGVIIHEYTETGGGAALYMSNSILDTATAQVVAPRALKLKIYPNPFRDQLNLDFVNEVAGNKVTVDVHDLQGRLVMRQHYNELPAGNNTLRIRTNFGAARGVFMISLKVNGKVVHTQKMLRGLER